HTQSVNCVAWSPDAQWIASASGEMHAPDGADYTVRFWKPDGTLIRTITGHRSPVYWVAWSPNCRSVASITGEQRGDTGSLRVSDLDGNDALIASSTGGNWGTVADCVAWS